jgi:hypothetical protein
VRLDRRRFLQLAGASAVLSTAGYAVHEGFAPVLEKIDLTLKRLPAAFDGMTIAQLSDFHYDDLFNAASISTAIMPGEHYQNKSHSRDSHICCRAALRAETLPNATVTI